MISLGLGRVELGKYNRIRKVGVGYRLDQFMNREDLGNKNDDDDDDDDE